MNTPYEMRFRTIPDVSDVKTFGCICFVELNTSGKLDARAEECRWVGFDPMSNGHRIYWPSRRRISVERDVTFSNREIPLLEGEDYTLDE